MLPLLLLSACTHDDDPASPAGDPLPPHAYPLQIASVTISADGQPQTRLADEGNTTSWQDNDQIMVSLGDKQAIYTYTGGKWYSDIPLCWESTAPATVTAWYPVVDEIDFTQQNTKGLTYLLKAAPVNATYNQSDPINLTFTHQLAKVRVLLEGEKAEDVEKVYVRSHPTSTHTQGTLDGLPTGSTADYFPMYKTTYEGKDCWEATLRPGTLQADNSFQVAKAEGKPVQVTLTNDIPIKAGEVYTINISVNPVIPENATDINEVAGEINDNGDYVVRNTYDKTINITGGTPTIYLESASISVDNGPAINVTSGDPTVRIVGNNSVTTKGIVTNLAAGIYVAHGSTITISGNNMEEDVLRITGGCDGAAIGGYCTGYDKHTNCGDITVSNVTVYAEASNNYLTAYAPGIGSTGSTCGTITITNAIVHARGFGDMYSSAPAIGAYESVPEIVITDSEIHAYRGSYNGTCYADYIGRGGSKIDYQGGHIQCGSGGSITGSTVYCYTGDTLDKTVEYDDQGNDKEITQ